MCGIAVAQQGLVGWGWGWGWGATMHDRLGPEKEQVACGMDRGRRTVYNKVGLSNLGEMTREG